ncbi:MULTISPECIES: acyltransferase family protein [unclassified Pseudoclavibacter]|uniref:acyltransferase family protein n=1 Tax=unclassified Pseudoclavibacter TaxID=2615177 RepID=UPI001BA6CFE7|nr:acyltransferase [Pseudoclavibacter sp. Marseille-Q4354]MBS3180157.1 acyltransferase [Pseudoclavibacter sp. Marseille-Q4354]
MVSVVACDEIGRACLRIPNYDHLVTLTGNTQTRAGSPSLGDALSGRDNALNFVRLGLATAVILGHSWVFGAFGHSVFADFADWSVNGFFAISGYLIVASRLRLSFWDYMWRRALRIFPAFWVVLIATGLVVAPLAAAASGERFELQSGLTYVFRNAALYIGQQGIEDTLMTVPFPYIWNLSLWTLVHEFSFYVVVAIALLVPWVRRNGLLFFCILVVVLVGFRIAAFTVLDLELSVFFKNTLRLGGFFAAGAVVYFLRDRIRVSWIWLGIATAVTGVFYAAGLLHWVGQLPFAVLVLLAGAKLPIRIGARNDISYGVYIWGAPVQQCLALAGGATFGPWIYALLALVATTPLALASWFWIESPALRLKSVFQGLQRPPVPTSAAANQTLQYDGK